MPTHVLVLIGPRGGSSELRDMVREIAARPPAAGVEFHAPVWLARDEACDIALEAPDSAAARAVHATVEAAYAELPIDVCLVPSVDRRKRLLVADMDSTIIQQECIDEMAAMMGIGAEIAAITERAMNGEIAFEPALRERVGLLAGLTVADLQRVLDQRIRLMPGATALIRTMRANGAYTALVSGGFTFFTSRIAARVGFDVDHANRLEMDGDRLTGKVVEPILGRDAKLAMLERYRGEHGLTPQQTLAVGDGANDLAMIQAAGLGVAYRAKPVVAVKADVAITHADLRGLLYLQGYRREEHVTDGEAGTSTD